jgi:hypothetical protein
MYIAYSALSSTENKKQDTNPEPEIQLRYQAYRDACNKYSNHIAVIQQYLPGWMPKFR